MILADRLRIRTVGVLVLVQIKTSSVTKAKTDKKMERLSKRCNT